MFLQNGEQCKLLREHLWVLVRAQKSYVPSLSQIQSYSVHKGSIWHDSTFVHYNIWLYKYLTLRCSRSQGSISNTGPTLRRVWRAQRFYLHIFARIAIVSLN